MQSHTEVPSPKAPARRLTKELFPLTNKTAKLTVCCARTLYDSLSQLHRERDYESTPLVSDLEWLQIAGVINQLHTIYQSEPFRALQTALTPDMPSHTLARVLATSYYEYYEKAPSPERSSQSPPYHEFLTPPSSPCECASSPCNSCLERWEESVSRGETSMIVAEQ